MGVDSVDDVVLIGHRNSTTVAVSMLSQVSQGQELRWTDANWDSEREFADWDSGRKFNPIMVAMDRTATWLYGVCPAGGDGPGFQLVSKMKTL